MLAKCLADVEIAFEQYPRDRILKVMEQGRYDRRGAARSSRDDKASEEWEILQRTRMQRAVHHAVDAA
jgi:hypothetical protein